MKKTKNCNLCGEELEDDYLAINKHKIDMHFWYVGDSIVD
mgnify:FL=1